MKNSVTYNPMEKIETKTITNFLKTYYVTIVLSVLGIFALATAILVAYPALAYIASVLFV